MENLLDQAPQRLREEIEDVLSRQIFQVVDYNRQYNVAIALRNEFYWRGKQFLSFNFEDGGVTFAEAQPPGGRGVTNQRTFAYNFNVTRSDGQKFIAVTGARHPNQNVVPNDIHSFEDVQAAKDGDALVRWLDGEVWDADAKQKDLARMLWRTGPAFAHLAYTVDGERFGITQVPRVEMETVTEPSRYECAECGAKLEVQDPGPDGVPVCGECGSPALSILPPQEYDVPRVAMDDAERGAPDVKFYTVLSVVGPLEAKSIDDYDYLVCETEESVTELARVYGLEAIRKIGTEFDSTTEGETPSQVQASAARLAVNSDVPGYDRSDSRRQGFFRHVRTWILPQRYMHFSRMSREWLEENCPNGVRLVQVQGELVDIFPERLQDCWDVCKTGTDDRVLGDPICNDLVPIQDVINNFFNLAIETVVRSIPQTVVSPMLLSRAAVENADPNVNEIIFANPGFAGNVREMMSTIPAASFSEHLIPLANLFRQMSREIDGVMEAAFGGGEPAPTWRQDQQRKNAAMQQFYMAFDEMSAFWRRLFMKAIKMLAKYGTGSVKVPGVDVFAFDSREIDLENLSIEGWRIEAEETMPESHAEEVDRFMELLAQPPQVQESLGLFHPANVSRVVELMGMRGFVAPLGDLFQKCIGVIRRLLEEEPISQIDPMTGMPAVDPMTGMPVEQPSMAPDPFEDKNAVFIAEVFRAYVNSRSGQEAKETKPGGFRNVLLYGLMVEQLAAAMMMPQQPAPEGAAPDGAPFEPAPGEAAPVPA